MTRCKITARRYDANGEPITAQHSTVIDTEYEEHREATSEGEISRAYIERFNVPQKDGSEIIVDSIERLADGRRERK